MKLRENPLLIFGLEFTLVNPTSAEGKGEFTLAPGFAFSYETNKLQWADGFRLSLELNGAL